MNYTILFTCLTVFCIILAIFEKKLTKYKNQEKRIKSLTKKQPEIIDEKLNLPFAQRFLAPIFSSILSAFSNKTPKKNRKSSSAKKLERDLILAGINMPPEEYSALKTIIIGGIIGLTTIIVVFLPIEMKTKALVVFASFILGILIPRYYLQAKVKNRQGAIRIQMADTMDLLSVSIEAGLSFDAALLRLSQQTKNELTEEFQIMQKEIQMGRSRRDALKELGMRNNIQELRIFASSMIQAEQYGISVKNVLKAQASQLRVDRRHKAEERAMKAPIKMMMPIIAFIFPIIFIILLGPAAFDIIASLGG